jgi:hypothetical protein
MDVDLRVNAQTKTHAEAMAFQQAKTAAVSSKQAVWYVDHSLCAACGVNGGLGSLMRQTGVNELFVHSPDGWFLIRAQQPSVPKLLR